MSIKTWYINRKCKQVEADLYLMLDTIKKDTNNTPTMDDVHSIILAWLIQLGHKRKYINKVVDNHFQCMYNNMKSQLGSTINELEKE